MSQFRERLTPHHLRQIWWVTRDLAEVLLRDLPDLCSWFVLREELTESEPLNLEALGPALGMPGTWLSAETARQELHRAEERLSAALNESTAPSALLPLVRSVVSALEPESLRTEAPAHALLLLRLLDSSWAGLSDPDDGAAEPGASAPPRIQMLGLRARLHELSGADDRAEHDRTRRLALQQRAGDAAGATDTLLSLAHRAARTGRTVEARRWLAQALPLIESSGSPQMLAVARHELATLDAQQGDVAAARQGYTAALQLREQIGDLRGEADILIALAALDVFQGDLVGARAGCHRALALYQQLGARLGEAGCRESLGLLLLAEGAVGEAFRSFVGVLRAHETLENVLGCEAAYGYLARCAARAGQVDQALLLAEESLAIGRRIQDRFGEAINLELQARLWLARHEFLPAAAAALLLAARLREIGREEQARPWAELTEQVLAQLPETLRDVLTEQPDAVRGAALEEAAARLAAEGRGLLDAPPAAGSEPNAAV